MKSSNDALKRYNLVLPMVLFDQLQQAADERHVTVVELLRKFVKLGLMAIQVEGNPSAALFIREGNTERQIVII